MLSRDASADSFHTAFSEIASDFHIEALDEKLDSVGVRTVHYVTRRQPLDPLRICQKCAPALFSSYSLLLVTNCRVSGAWAAARVEIARFSNL
jgi:hypothetical protein